MWALRKDGLGWLFSITGAVAWLFHLCAGLSPTARPDAMGLLLFLVGALFPYFDQFSLRSVILTSVLCVAALLTKPYFLVGGALVFGYTFLFASKRSALLGALCFVLLSFAAVYVMQRGDSFYLCNLLPINGATISRSYVHFAAQAGRYAFRNSGFIIAGLLAAALSPKERPPSLWRRMFDHPVKLNPNPTGARCNYRPEYAAFFTLCMATLLIVLLGPTTGQTRLYYDQLLSPFLYWWLLKQIEVLRRSKCLAICILAVGGAVSPFTFNIPKVWRPRVDLSGWFRAEQEIENHTNVFAGPLCAHLLLREGRPVYDTGQTWASKLALDKGTLSGVYLDRCQAYLRELAGKVERRQFDLIVLDSGAENLVNSGLVKTNYARQGGCSLDVSLTDKVEIEFWIPRR
jgi:hypothetical protein